MDRGLCPFLSSSSGLAHRGLSSPAAHLGLISPAAHPLSSEAVWGETSRPSLQIEGPGHLPLYTSATSSSHAGEGIDVDACRRGQGPLPLLEPAERAAGALGFHSPPPHNSSSSPSGSSPS